VLIDPANIAADLTAVEFKPGVPDNHTAKTRVADCHAYRGANLGPSDELRKHGQCRADELDVDQA
jgi:hypothetical protein